MIGYFRRLRRERQDKRVMDALFAQALEAFTAAPARELPPPVTSAFTLTDWRALLDTYAASPAPAWDVAVKGPIKLTRRQLDAVGESKRSPLDVYGLSVTSLYGVPVVVVATVEESTPYTEGWITA